MLIGIDAYNHANFPNLDNARRDAVRIKQILEDVYGFEHIGIPLVDSITTHANIIYTFAELAYYCLEEDNLIIFLQITLLYKSKTAVQSNPVLVFRIEVMKQARIGRRNYNKCMRICMYSDISVTSLR